MSRGLQITSGAAVLFTTLAFSHIMFHDTLHLLHHEGSLFVTVHTVLAIALAIFSFIGAYFLLIGGRRQKSG
jgi:hypothetical protein